MTCLNVFIGRNHALVATDSHARIGGDVVPVTKVFAMPHVSGVFSGRGSPLTILTAYGVAFGSCFPDGDAMAAGLATAIEAGWRDCRAYLGDSPMTSEIVFVWWSAKAKRMRGVHCSGFETGPCQIREIENTFNAPIFPEIDTSTMPTDPEGMARLMAEQVAGMKRYHPAEATGGRMFCTWVREGDIHTRDEGKIADVETA